MKGKKLDAVLNHQAALRYQRAVHVTYLQAKVLDEDWHGVCDAANDLREIDAELRGLEAKG